MVDIGTLASTVVTLFLVPYVKSGVEKIGAQVAEKIGSDVAEKIKGAATSIWSKVKTAFASDKDKATFEQFEEYPDESKALIETLLKKKLEQDAQLAEELDKIVNAVNPQNQQTNAQIMNAGIAGIVQINSLSGNNNQIGGVIMGSNLPGPQSPSDK